MLAHPRVLSTKERAPKVRSSLPIRDRWKPHRTLIMPPSTQRIRPSHAHTTPRHMLRCRGNRMSRLLGCYPSIAPIFGISRLRSLARMTTRRWQGPGVPISTPHRDARYAATESYTKGDKVATVGIASTLAFRGYGVRLVRKMLRLGVPSSIESTVRTHPSPPDDVPPRYP